METKGPLMRNLKPLRIAVIVLLALLALQFELGMAVNLSPNLKEVPPVGVADLWKVIASVGEDALAHAVLRIVLVAAAVVGLVLSLLARAASVSVIGVIAFLGTTVAAVNGVLFTLSGFKNDGYSHGMATGFLVAFTLWFVQVCLVSARLRGQGTP